METKHKEFKPFDKVLIRFNENHVWVIELYSHWDNKDNEHILHYGRVNDDDILPYDGNEDLLGKVGNPTPKRWRAGENEWFWYISTSHGELKVGATTDDYTDEDNNHYNDGNYFRTEKETRKKLEQIKQILKGE